MMIAILLGATSMAGAAFAATIYTDHALWLAAVGTVTMDTFEENGAAGFTSYGSTHNGADFTITGTNLYTVDPAYFSYYNWNSGDVLDFESPPGSIVASGDFGFNYGNPAELFGTGIVTVDGSTYNLIGQPTFNFFGITGATGAVVINFNGGLGIVDNFSVAAVPEPAS